MALGDLPATDANNPSPALQARPLCGMAVLNDFEWQNGAWNGRFYEPQNGTDYAVSMVPLDNGTVRVAGHSGRPVLSRTMSRPFEIWQRVAMPNPRCGNPAATS